MIAIIALDISKFREFTGYFLVSLVFPKVLGNFADREARAEVAQRVAMFKSTYILLSYLSLLVVHGLNLSICIHLETSGSEVAHLEHSYESEHEQCDERGHVNTDGDQCRHFFSYERHSFATVSQLQQNSVILQYLIPADSLQDNMNKNSDALLIAHLPILRHEHIERNLIKNLNV